MAALLFYLPLAVQLLLQVVLRRDFADFWHAPYCGQLESFKSTRMHSCLLL